MPRFKWRRQMWAGLLLLLASLFFWRPFSQLFLPNLLANPNFSQPDLSGWHVVNQGQAQARVMPPAQVAERPGLRLDISGGSSWVGVGQRVAVEPGQPYRLQLTYQWSQGDERLGLLLLQVRQFDQAGQLLKSNQITPPASPMIGLGGSVEAGRRDFSHTFVTDRNTSQVEVGVGLSGQQAARVNLTGLTLQANPTWSVLIWPGSLIAVGLGLLLVGGGYLLFLGGRRLPVALRYGFKVRPRMVALIGVNLLLLLLFAELLGLAGYFWQTGHLFYTHSKLYNLFPTAGESGELTAKRIHPYFGYVDRPGWLRSEDNFWQNVDPAFRTINNHGFGSTYDYPFIKNSDRQLLVGIFGGSVAEQFAIFGGDRLIEVLQRDGRLAGRDIELLNFAKSGYKQPQQAITLTYFLSIGQQFDLVINLDGFNEVAFGHRNYQRHVDFSMPNMNIMDGLLSLTNRSTLTPEKLALLAQINEDKTSLNRLATRLNRNRFASLNFVLGQYYGLVFNRYSRALRQFGELESDVSAASLLFVKPEKEIRSDLELFGRIAGSWADSSLLMHDLLAGRNIGYLHVLQPNQYYSNKIFSEEEARIALEVQPYYATLVKLGYPALLDQVDRLQAHDVDFYNGLPLFDRETKTIYQDNCCHYNALGNQLLADFIGASILESKALGARLKPDAARQSP